MRINLLIKYRICFGVIILTFMAYFLTDGTGDHLKLKSLISKLKPNTYFSGFDAPKLQSSLGLAYLEPWGQWSEHHDGAKNEVIFRLSGYIPHSFTLELKVKAFGPNTQLPTEVIIGNQSKSVIISSEQFKVYKLRFDKVAYGISEIRVIPPSPTSPAEIGSTNLGDMRKLGIGFSSINIISNKVGSKVIAIYPDR